MENEDFVKHVLRTETKANSKGLRSRFIMDCGFKKYLKISDGARKEFIQDFIETLNECIDSEDLYDGE